MKEAGVYTIAFSVTNSQGLSASVNRTLVVEPVCPSGETLCSNKVTAPFTNLALTYPHLSPNLMLAAPSCNLMMVKGRWPSGNMLCILHLPHDLSYV